MLEKLKNLLLYAGAEPEDFARCQMDVQIANRRRLTAFLGTACAFFVALTLGSCMVPLLYDYIPVLQRPSLSAWDCWPWSRCSRKSWVCF